MSLSAEVVEQLKRIIRGKGLTYRDVAKRLGLSEAAVKRAFSERAFSLKRIDQICDAIEISSKDLYSAMREEKPLQRVLTQDQELLLASDEKLLCFFYMIAGHVSLAKVKKLYRFSDQEVDRYLVALDKGGLIRLESRNRFKILVGQHFYWPRHGALYTSYSGEIRSNFAADDFDDDLSGEIFASGLLTRSSLDVLRKRLRQLEDEMLEMVNLDAKYRQNAVHNVTLFCGFRPWILPMIHKYRRSKSST